MTPALQNNFLYNFLFSAQKGSNAAADIAKQSFEGLMSEIAN